MLRVIRTDMYFDASLITWTVKNKSDYPGVSIGWMHFRDGENLTSNDLNELFDANFIKVPIDKFPGDLAKTIIELSLQGARSDEVQTALTSGSWPIKNHKIIDEVLNSEIVFETSPAKTIILQDLLKKVSVGAVGIPVGMILADALGCYPLMIATIPLSAFFIGTALNLTKGVGIIII
jgi:hypothetical protein